jgi:hypothetical protein
MNEHLKVLRSLTPCFYIKRVRNIPLSPYLSRHLGFLFFFHCIYDMMFIGRSSIYNRGCNRIYKGAAPSSSILGIEEKKEECKP